MNTNRKGLIGATIAASTIALLGVTGVAMAAGNDAATTTAPDSAVSVAADPGAADSMSEAAEGPENEADDASESAEGPEGTESASDGADQGPDANPNEPGHQDVDESGETAGEMTDGPAA